MNKLQTGFLLIAITLAAVLGGCITDSSDDSSGDDAFTLKGSLVDTTGAALPGVTVTLEGVSLSRTSTSDSEGFYSFDDLEPGAYTVTPALSGVSFTPPAQAANINDADITIPSFTGCMSSDGSSKRERLLTIYNRHRTTVDSLAMTALTKMKLAAGQYVSARSTANTAFVDTCKSIAARWSDSLAKRVSSADDSSWPGAFTDASEDHQNAVQQAATDAVNELNEANENYQEQSEDEDQSFADDIATELESDDGGDSGGGDNLVSALETAEEEYGGTDSDGDYSEDFVNAAEEAIEEGSGEGGDGSESNIDNITETLDQLNPDDGTVIEETIIDILVEDILGTDFDGYENEAIVDQLDGLSDDFLDGHLTEEELLNDLLELYGDDSPATSFSLRIEYIEDMNYIADKINTTTHAETKGTVLFNDIDAEGVGVFEGSGILNHNSTTIDKVSNIKTTDTGFANVDLNGVYDEDGGGPGKTLHLFLHYSYEITSTMEHPELGTISVPGVKDDWTDEVHIEYEDGAVKVREEDMGMSSMSATFVLHFLESH